MTKIRSLFFTLVIMGIGTALSFASEVKPVSTKKDDKCPVCGMFVAKYTHWLAEVVFRDGTYAVFDGPKDMFKYYLNLQKYAPAKKTADITGIFVTEYYSTKLIDARKLFFVIGSDVYGPMGDELIPLFSEADAREFMRDHKGTRILKFPEVTNALLH
ncbi:MAG: nitrous oxide reductase accessory protein NosL [Nitrospirae bacterium]|nr:nitrous oxide reductase accessory protein NosL [Nitrospirota bacterium]